MSNPSPTDIAAYTYGTSITPSVYEQLLQQHAQTGVAHLLSKHNFSLRTRSQHNICYTFPNEASKTAKDYIVVLNGLLFFLNE